MSISRLTHITKIGVEQMGNLADSLKDPDLLRLENLDTDLRVIVEETDQLPALPAAIEVAAYRIAQEALTNVVRHAHACNCTVRLSLLDGIQLEVTDDGVGLPAEQHTGVGLLSMRECATEVGGSCEIEPTPGHGTRVLVRLPLPKE